MKTGDVADQLVEGSIYNQIKAIESWAINTKNESENIPANIDLVMGNLRKINRQALNIWRKDFKNLPKGALTEDLKQKLILLRAAVKTLRYLRKDKKLFEKLKVAP